MKLQTINSMQNKIGIYKPTYLRELYFRFAPLRANTMIPNPYDSV